jgi:hypothetical protein
MKDFAICVGNSAKSAVEAGIYVFLCVVSVGIGWKLGNKIVEKVEKKLEEK